MHFIKAAFIVFEVVLLFNLLIFVHELGHFLAARWRGLKIERFAVWFGKPIWKTRINGVEYVLGSIPAGGYVQLPQMAPMDIIEGKTEKPADQLPPVSAMDKIIVAIAGPLFSIGLAFAFAVIVWGIGKPDQKTKDAPVIGWVVPKGPAEESGLRPGDKILEVDGHAVNEFGSTSQDSVVWRIVTSEGTNIPIKYLRDGKEAIAYPVPVRPETKWYERRSLRKVMMSAALPSIIGRTASNSPAALAGFKEGDEVVAFNGEKIYSPETIDHAEKLMTNGIKPAVFTIKRGTNHFDATLLAVKPSQPTNATPSFGITAWMPTDDEVLTHPKPMDQIRESAGQIIATIKALTSRKSDIGVQQLGGVVMIARVYINLLDSENGWRRVLWFSVVLNVNLALLNMLPLPVLDGGHITLALIEVIRRRPVSAKFLNVLQSAFAMLLIGFMAFIAILDVSDWVRSAHADRPQQPIVFEPPKK